VKVDVATEIHWDALLIWDKNCGELPDSVTGNTVVQIIPVLNTQKAYFRKHHLKKFSRNFHLHLCRLAEMTDGHISTRFHFPAPPDALRMGVAIAPEEQRNPEL
jgi:hypothetical protein